MKALFASAIRCCC